MSPHNLLENTQKHFHGEMSPLKQQCFLIIANQRPHLTISTRAMFGWGFPGDSVVRNLPANVGDGDQQVQSLGREDLLEEKIATHSSILARIIPWTEEPGGLQSMRLPRIGHEWATELDNVCTAGHLFLLYQLYQLQTSPQVKSYFFSIAASFHQGICTSLLFT